MGKGGVKGQEKIENLIYSQVSIKRANSLNTYGMVLSELARLIET